jgi:hypothetical protein
MWRNWMAVQRSLVAWHRSCTVATSRDHAASGPETRGGIMSYPYPQDRRREQREKGQKQYEDAVETFTENEAEIRREAGIPHDEQVRRNKEDQEHDAEDRFEEIGDEVAGEGERSSR